MVHLMGRPATPAGVHGNHDVGRGRHRRAPARIPATERSEVKQPFEKVVEEHGHTVLRVVRAVLGPYDADDAWSETFISAMGAYPDLPHEANVEAWLVTIAHRKAIDVLRAAKRRAMPVDEISGPPHAPHSVAVDGSSGPELLDTLELWAAVRTLPDKQRQAVAYHYVAGLPYVEIARILGGTTEAARRAAADGIKNLRKIYPGGMTEGAPS